MASTTRYFAGNTNIGTLPRYFQCDTEADLPSSGLTEGDLAYTQDTNKNWAATSATTWQEIGAGGGHPDLATHDALGLATQAELDTHAGAADPHTVYQKESEKAAANGYASLDANTRVPDAQLGTGTPSASNFLRGDRSWAVPAGGSGPTTLRKTADQIINGTAYQNITDLTFAVSANTDYAFQFYIVFRSAATTTGFRFSINGPAGAVVDYHIKHQTIANTTTTLAATWIEGHCVVYDTLTVLASTVTANVDLVCMIQGRIKVAGTAGTLAARAASEAANNDIVVQKGSWGLWF